MAHLSIRLGQLSFSVVVIPKTSDIRTMAVEESVCATIGYVFRIFSKTLACGPLLNTALNERIITQATSLET